jgi:hypothetical protein
MPDLKVFYVPLQDRWAIKTDPGEEALLSFERREKAERFLEVIKEHKQRSTSRNEDAYGDDNW